MLRFHEKNHWTVELADDKWQKAKVNENPENWHCGYLTNRNSIRQSIEKMKINNCLNKLNELKCGEVSRNSISNRCWKFQLSILKNKKVLFLKKYLLSRIAKVDPKDGFSRPNFQWRFWDIPLHLTLSAI